MTEREQLIQKITSMLNGVHRVALLDFICHLIERILEDESIPH